MKKAIFIILALALTFSLAGCRGRDADGTVTTSPGMTSPTPYNHQGTMENSGGSENMLNSNPNGGLREDQDGNETDVDNAVQNENARDDMDDNLMDDLENGAEDAGLEDDGDAAVTDGGDGANAAKKPDVKRK